MKECSEVSLKNGENTNGLGLLLKDIIERNLNDSRVRRKMENLECTAVIELTDMNVATTLYLEKGKISIKNGAIKSPDVYIGADFITLADVSSGKMHPIVAKLKKKLRTRGSLLKLLKVQKLLAAK